MADNSKSGDRLGSAVNSLGEQTKKLDIATHYTHGDFEKAKQMVSGVYKDLFAIKARFSSSSMYGAFLIFFNSVYITFENFYGIVSHSFSVEDMKTNVDWKIFEQQIAEALAEGEHDAVLTAHVKEELASGLTLQFGNELKRLIDQDDEISVNHAFQKIAQTRLGFQNIKITIDYDQITSLEMELFSVSSRKIDVESIRQKQEEEEAKKKEPVIEKIDEDPLKGKEVKLTLRGSLILAPIKGKDISKIIPGDRVKVKIIDSNPRGVDVAKAFDAYKEGEILPITGRVVTSKHMTTGGYKFAVIVAKGIYVVVEEEEENIKVAMDPSSNLKPGNSEEEKSGMSIPVLIVLVLVFLGLVGVVLSFLL